MTIPAVNIRLGKWDEGIALQPPGHHALFNSPALAKANELEGHIPFVLEINDNQYLAYKRHASAVLAGLSLADEVALLENIQTLREVFSPMGIRNLSLNTLNALSDLDALASAISLGCGVRFEYVLDLDEYSPGKISSNHKRNIKKSEKAGALLVLPASLEGMRAHIEMVNLNLGSKGIGGITSSPEYLKSLITQESGLLAQVTEGGELLASTYFIVNENSAYYHSSGTSDRGKKIGAAHFLVASMITQMRERDMRYLNLGGCTAEQVGLQRFKVGFRPEARVLASTSRQLTTTRKRKIRSLFSMKARDFCSIKRVNVYLKTLSAPVIVGERANHFEEIDWELLVNAAAETPELGDALIEFCRGNSCCYALSDQKRKILAIAFLVKQPAGQGPGADGVPPPVVSCMEIIGLRPVNAALDDGVGNELVRYLEQKALALGSNRLVCRVNPQDSASENLLVSAGFSFAGNEKILSSAIMGGVSRVVGRVDT